MSADTGTGYKYSREEITAFKSCLIAVIVTAPGVFMKSLFDSCDRDRTGHIHIN
jgi:hypothetical protein